MPPKAHLSREVSGLHREVLRCVLTFRNAGHLTATLSLQFAQQALLSQSARTETWSPNAPYLRAGNGSPPDPSGRRDAMCDLPVVNVTQALAGVYRDDAVGVQEAAASRGLPAVKDPRHGQQPPAAPDFLPDLKAGCDIHAAGLEAKYTGR